MKTFELTEDHLKLLRRMFVGWEDCETGAPAVDPKRPYGNSYVPGDVGEILGWEPACRDDHTGERWLSGEQEDAAYKIHRETEHALQIAIWHGPIVGMYRDDGNGWEPVK